MHAVGDKVIVNSALHFGTIVGIEHTGSGPRYAVQMDDGHVLYRYYSELT